MKGNQKLIVGALILAGPMVILGFFPGAFRSFVGICLLLISFQLSRIEDILKNLKR